MNTVITIVCCLIPCIGLILGLMIRQKGNKRKKKGDLPGAPSAELLCAIGMRIFVTAVILLLITVLVLWLAPADTGKARFGMAVVIVTVQYAAAMVLIFMVSGMLQKDKAKRIEREQKKDA